MKTGQISIQTLFFVMMGILFVGILIFGINRIFFVQDILTEQERIEIQQEVKRTLEFCSDPINRGAIQEIKIKNSEFNGVCFLNNNLETELNPAISTMFDELRLLYDAGENIVLIKTSFDNDRVLLDHQIVDSFDSRIQQKSFCEFNYDNSVGLDFSFKCE